MRRAREFMVQHPGGVVLGRNAFTGNVFGLEPDDRRGHMWVPGASGGGKSNFLEVMIRQDILQADGVPRGLVFLDPHGKTTESLLGWIAENRLHKHRTIRLIDLSDPSYAFSLNPFRSAAHFAKAVLADTVSTAIAQVFMARTLMEQPRTYALLWEMTHAIATLGITFCEGQDFIRRSDRRGVRHHLIERLGELDEDGADFWLDLEDLSPSRRHEFVEPLANRLRPFLRSPYVRRIFGQTGRTLDLAAAMDRGEIILINLKPGTYFSAIAARLIGTLLVNEFYTACFRRKKVGEKELPFYLYIDECQNYLSPDIARILDESRKFGLFLILAHQHLGHLREAGERLFRSVVTNTRTKAVFGGLDPDDAEYITRIIWRGQLDLQRFKPRLVRPAAVGHRLVWLEQEGESRGTAHAVGGSWSSGEAETRSRSDTSSWAHSSSTGRSVADVDMRSTSQGASSGEVFIPGDGILEPGRLVSESSGSNSGSGSSRGTVVSQSASETDTAGSSVSHGRSTTRSSSRGGSVSDTVSHSLQHGRAQAFETIYDKVPGPIWDLNEQIHTHSVSLANVPIGQMHVRVGSKRPRRITVPYVGDSQTLPEQVARIREKLLRSTPFVTTGEQAGIEYREYRAGLLAAAAPKKADPAQDDGADEAWT